MTLCCTEEAKKNLTVRLNRIEGQVRGVNKMIANNRECIDILTQIISVQVALKSVWKTLAKNHLHGCVIDALKNGTDGEELFEELIENLDKFSR